MQHVLVPLDTSELAERALDFACDIVGPGGTITLVSVVEAGQPERYIESHAADPYLWSEYGRVDTSTMQRSVIDRAEAYLRGHAATLQAGGYVVNMLTPGGDAATIILESAEQVGAEAIVMSTHGRSGISRLIYGSVTQEVLRAAHCPVFVVPMRAAA